MIFIRVVQIVCITALLGSNVRMIGGSICGRLNTNRLRVEFPRRLDSSAFPIAFPAPSFSPSRLWANPSQKGKSWNSDEPTWLPQSLPDPPYWGVLPELSGIQVGEWWWEGRKVDVEWTGDSWTYTRRTNVMQPGTRGNHERAHLIKSGGDSWRSTVNPHHHAVYSPRHQPEFFESNRSAQ